MKLTDVFEVAGNGVMYVLTATQTKEIFEIVSLVLSIAISLLIITSKIATWVKKSMEDGKIDNEELEELTDILEQGKKGIKENENKK